MPSRCERREPPMSQMGKKLKISQRAQRVRFAPKDGVIGRPSLWIAEDFGCCASG